MKRPLTPSLSPSDGERVAGGRVRGWFMVPLHAKDETALSMNRPLTPSLSPSDGERVAEGRVRGGSWSQCMRKSERGLSMNLRLTHEPPRHPVPLPLRGGEVARPDRRRLGEGGRSGEGRGCMVPLREQTRKQA